MGWNHHLISLASFVQGFALGFVLACAEPRTVYAVGIWARDHFFFADFAGEAPARYASHGESWSRSATCFAWRQAQTPKSEASMINHDQSLFTTVNKHQSLSTINCHSLLLVTDHQLARHHIQFFYRLRVFAIQSDCLKGLSEDAWFAIYHMDLVAHWRLRRRSFSLLSQVTNRKFQAFQEMLLFPEGHRSGCCDSAISKL